MPSIPGFKEPVYDDRAKFFFIRLFMKFGMKNPYEEKKDVLSPELFTKKATAAREIRGRCEHYLREIRYLVGDLEKLWTNTIQTSLTAELGSIRNSLADYTELMEEYALLLEYASRELSSDPETAKKVAEQSEASEEPVPYAFKTSPDLRRPLEDEPVDAAFGIPGMRRFVVRRDLAEIITVLLKKVGIGRRNKENRTQLLIQGLKSMALDMRSCITQFNFHVSKMRYATDDMAKLWENESHASLIGEFGNIEGPVKDFSNIIDEYATLLEMAAHELETNAVDSGIGSVLSEKESGPVSIVLSSIPSLKRSRIDLKAYDPYFERTQTGVSTVVIGTKKNSEYIYNVYEDHIELVKYVGMYRAVEVPRELDGLPVTHIGLDCFALAWRVRFVSITIPDSVTTIYHGAFRNCQYIREFKLPKSLRYIGNYAFAFIQDLEHIAIPDGVVSLGMGAFRNCDNLKEISIPDSVLRIGNDCFYCCRNLSRAVLGNGVVEIDGWAFRMCEHLAEVDLGDSVVNIGEAAFYDDVLLMRLDIPTSVRKIGEHAFYHRRGMTLGVTPGSFAEWHAREFNQQYALVK